MRVQKSQLLFKKKKKKPRAIYKWGPNTQAECFNSERRQILCEGISYPLAKSKNKFYSTWESISYSPIPVFAGGRSLLAGRNWVIVICVEEVLGPRVKECSLSEATFFCYGSKWFQMAGWVIEFHCRACTVCVELYLSAYYSLREEFLSVITLTSSCFEQRLKRESVYSLCLCLMAADIQELLMQRL